MEAVCSFELCPAIIVFLLYSNHLFTYLSVFLFHPLLLCRRFAQNIESLLNARSWGSIEQNEQDDPLQREEIDNKQENEDNFKQ